MELPQNDGDSLGNLLEEYIQSIDSPNQFSDNGWFINTTQSTVITTFTSEEAGKDLLEELLETPATFDHQDEGFHGHNPQYDFVDDTNFFPETIESLFPINQLVEQDWAFGPSQGDLGSNTNSAVEEIDGTFCDLQ
ncbi:unnamed protein product [Linum trigynum]|uniref:Uncharacterized protein n=1 Tax=Linum trigynum TaxID=586398 RepID=A0AAV2CJ12_9ROSI